jgi:hypothetical protein
VKLNGKQVTLAPGHGLEDQTIIVQYAGSFPGSTSGELKKWQALRKSGSAITLEPAPGLPPIRVIVVSAAAVRASNRPTDPAHTVYVEVRRPEAAVEPARDAAERAPEGDGGEQSTAPASP